MWTTGPKTTPVTPCHCSSRRTAIAASLSQPFTTTLPRLQINLLWLTRLLHLRIRLLDQIHPMIRADQPTRPTSVVHSTSWSITATTQSQGMMLKNSPLSLRHPG